jgi:hypothetical protein
MAHPRPARPSRRWVYPPSTDAANRTPFGMLRLSCPTRLTRTALRHVTPRLQIMKIMCFEALRISYSVALQYYSRLSTLAVFDHLS